MPSSMTYRWYSRYLSEPVRELMDAGPAAAESALRSPRTADVCILFTDIRGFSAMSRRIDPDSLVETTNGFIARHSQMVRSFGGYIDTFTGDGVMAVFEGERMAENACRCALRVVSPSVGVGLHRGRVVMGTLGCRTRMTYTAIGDTVNVAARLCQHARGREVITTESVREETHDGRGLRFRRLWGPVPRDIDPALPLYELGGY